MNLVIKVADFGLSVNTGTKEYYRSINDMGIKLPFRWMAPECLTDYMFSESSDVVYKRTIEFTSYLRHPTFSMLHTKHHATLKSMGWPG